MIAVAGPVVSWQKYRFIKNRKAMMDSNLAKLDEATRMLAEIRTVQDARKLVNLAEAARVYARQVELGLEAQNYAAEI